MSGHYFMFKKTLPSASLLQLTSNTHAVKSRALAALQQNNGDFRLNLIALALKGKKVSFAKVLTMVDEMVKLLKSEQVKLAVSTEGSSDS